MRWDVKSIIIIICHNTNISILLLKYSIADHVSVNIFYTLGSTNMETVISANNCTNCFTH